jgi:hypothetical protein
MAALGRTDGDGHRILLVQLFCTFIYLYTQDDVAGIVIIQQHQLDAGRMLPRPSVSTHVMSNIAGSTGQRLLTCRVKGDIDTTKYILQIGVGKWVKKIRQTRSLIEEEVLFDG